ncbi:MAG: lamin tail domain-containing protein [Nanoarchaeota archaeon]
MKKSLIFLLTVIVMILSTLVSAKVFINEFESDPDGSDNKEWIELYNDGGSSVNISDWSLVDEGNDTDSIPGGTVIGAGGYFVFNETIHTSLSLDSVNEQITLLNDTGDIEDITIFGNDSDDNGDVFARVFDGNEIWQFQDGTPEASNPDLVNPNITNQSRDLNPVFEDDDVELSVSIFENYLQEVRINGTWTGIWEVFDVFSAVINITQSNHSYTVTNDNLESGEFVEWHYIAEDSSGNIEYGEIQNFTVRNITLVNITPSSPDGNNSYYITLPEFDFIMDSEAISTFYRFDSLDWNLFVGPFLFDINGTLGGIERLDFFSGYGERNETVQNITVKVDVFGPELMQMYPAGTIIGDSANLNGFLDDKFQSNSGLDLGSLVMELDSSSVSSVVNSIDELKATFNYSASNLSEGNHTVNLTVYDNAGNLGGGTWLFVVNLTSNILTVNSPIDGDYGTRRLRFDIDGNVPGEIIYLDNGRERILCRNCVTLNKTVSLIDGEHNLTFRVGTEEVNRSIFIDSRAPIISKITPKSNSFVNGTVLGVKYTEDFLESINVEYENFSSVLVGCESGRNKVCEIDVDLGAFNGQYINFSFNVSDKVTSINSDIHTLFVDTTNPVITRISPDGSNQTRRVRIDLSLSEVVKDLEFIDFNDKIPRERRLCRNCQFYNETRTFSSGNHSLQFIAIDNAGNYGFDSVDFIVV